jgi:hypothetical protein
MQSPMYQGGTQVHEYALQPREGPRASRALVNSWCFAREDVLSPSYLRNSKQRALLFLRPLRTPR